MSTVDRAISPAHVPLADSFLHLVLYVTILTSFFVFVQPAPYEYLAVLLAFACVLARVQFSRFILPLLLLLLIRDVFGAIGLLRIYGSGFMGIEAGPSVLLPPVYDYVDSTRFLATSFYLGLTAVLFACIFEQDTMRRLATLRAAYVMSGVVASVIGTLGYFNVFFNFIPGLDIFSLNERAVAGFKDPNVLGCFLIPPLTWLIEGFIVDRIRLHNLIASIIIFVGLLLAFSRAAWGCFLFSTLLLVYFLYLTQPSRRSRNRIILFVVAGAVVGLLVFIALNSIDVVGHMFESRAHLQTYDLSADNRSRILLWQDSFREIFLHPLGMGPWGFAHDTNWVSHNSYLGTFLNNGWIGGNAYLLLTILTLGIGLKAMRIRTPWQTFLIATYTPFVGLVIEAFVIDTDHWRHYYLLVGVIWALAAATMKYRYRAAAIADHVVVRRAASVSTA